MALPGRRCMLPDRVEPHNYLFRQLHKEDKTFFRSCPFNYSRFVRAPVALQISIGSFQKTEGKLQEVTPLELEKLVQADGSRLNSPVALDSAPF
eukprot:CAMPEP_0184723544 /NCGR_PEP_ID=MMETSP0314-20130426/25449_1 /TAXON_ID=38298 /ORGANISM="Rhodella maculata, Strain CCMP 736" /LENGTH=93 /DNA_ID=CAMNT_0027188363 /DNA_START=29 /DNA_END=307 /DNA_ORIENTATION=-